MATEEAAAAHVVQSTCDIGNKKKGRVIFTAAAVRYADPDRQTTDPEFETHACLLLLGWSVGWLADWLAGYCWLPLK